MPLLEQAFKNTFDPHFLPEPVQDPGSTQRTAGHKFKGGCTCFRFITQGLLGSQEPVDAPDQSLQCFPVNVLFAAEVVRA